MLKLAARACRQGGAILCFHSITTPGLPSAGTAHVSQESFLAFVKLARRMGEVVPLSEFVRRHRQGRSTAGLIAITFDDAYAALKTTIRQAIEQEDVPVAIFVVTGAAATGATFWWDRVDDVFPKVAAERWRAFETECGLPDAYRQGQPAQYGPLRPFRQWLLAAHAGRWPAHLEPALSALEAEVGSRTRHRSMTFDEIHELTRFRGVEVGVHTISHPVLPLLSDSELHHEITASYQHLRERFGEVLPVLAIPFGLFDERTLRAARSAGMTASFTLAGIASVREKDQHDLGRLCMMRGVSSARLGLDLLGLPGLLRKASGRSPVRYPDLPSATT
jgi:peptidoglycan/xylan/chitin deacetylase (PgdA/CDA1 family)